MDTITTNHTIYSTPIASNEFAIGGYSDAFFNTLQVNDWVHGINLSIMPTIDKLIFNPPYTIVYWKGVKEPTIVKAMEGTEFDFYYGLCAAVAKKVLGGNAGIKNALKNSNMEKAKVKMNDNSDQ